MALLRFRRSRDSSRHTRSVRRRQESSAASSYVLQVVRKSAGSGYLTCRYSHSSRMRWQGEANTHIGISSVRGALTRDWRVDLLVAHEVTAVSARMLAQVVLVVA